MGCTVRELLNRIDTRELVEWESYFLDEPFGDNVLMVQSAIIACTIAQVNAKKGKKIKLEDFMVRFSKRGKKQSMEEMSKVLMSMVGGDK